MESVAGTPANLIKPPNWKNAMSAELLKEIKKVHPTLVKAGLVVAEEFGTDFKEAKTMFNTSLEGIDVSGKVEGKPKETKVYDTAIDLYEKLNPDEETEETSEETSEETPPPKAPAKDKSKGKAVATKAPAKDKSKGKVAAQAAKDKHDRKKPGVVAAILEALAGASKTKPITKADIHVVLEKAFPERVSDKMMVSINTVVSPNSSWMSKLKLVVIKDERPWKYYLGK